MGNGLCFRAQKEENKSLTEHLLSSDCGTRLLRPLCRLVAELCGPYVVQTWRFGEKVSCVAPFFRNVLLVGFESGMVQALEHGIVRRSFRAHTEPVHLVLPLASSHVVVSASLYHLKIWTTKKRTRLLHTFCFAPKSLLDLRESRSLHCIQVVYSDGEQMEQSEINVFTGHVRHGDELAYTSNTTVPTTFLIQGNCVHLLRDV